jgi:hypothetical protein
MTVNAFKLGTVLSLGWFWFRVSGCSVLYRGGSMEQIDFSDILTVAEKGTCEISPPGYVHHNNNSTYFYVVRFVNNCGEQEYTLTAAVKVTIDSDGNLARLQPNNIFCAKAEQVFGNRVKLVWYYCPLGQRSKPAHFKIYFDGGSGEIDYENPIGVIRYAGQIFYSHISDTLTAGKYLFCIKTEDAAGVEDDSYSLLGIQLDNKSPGSADILSIEAV